MEYTLFQGRRTLATLSATLLLGLGLTISSARADTPAIDFTSPTANYTNGSWSLGWEFTVNQAIDVTSVGFYDDQRNGLTAGHPVGIFDAATNLLASATVAPGDPLTGFFR